MRAAGRGLVAAAVLLIPASAFGEGTAHAESHAGTLVWHAVNLIVLLSVLVYFLRAPIRGFFATRRRDIEHNLERAAAVLREAEERLADWKGRMARLDTEIQEIRRLAHERAEAERRQILADAEAAAARIRRDGAAAVEQEQRRARDALRKEAADLAIELAGELLRQQVTDAD
ncbi:MAG TPA: ATP synthase F0 subunit B, partial [Myxococcota bacterium]|nr:ATP synthase F0 subunit B [Myxococcota bacterium]